MREDGSYLSCSNATDSTGYYTYRKSGKHDGECLGIDFTLAKQDYDGHGSCKTNDRICDQHLLRLCVCLLLSFALGCSQSLNPFPRLMVFLRDAIFTLASGLHEVLEVQKGSVDGVHLRKIMHQQGLPNGVTGDITFESGNSDRDYSQLAYTVSNFQGDQFVRLGSIAIKDWSFAPCTPSHRIKCSNKAVFRGLCERIADTYTCDHTNVPCFCCWVQQVVAPISSTCSQISHFQQ